MKQISIITCSIVLISSSLVSCVSKKKYDDLMRAKMSSDRSVIELQNANGSLQKELSGAKTSFNNVRYELTLSNATKDKEIDNLYQKLRKLEQKENSLRSELDDASQQIKYKEVSAEQQIGSLESAVKQLTVERQSLIKEVADTKFRLEKQNSELKGRLVTLESQMSSSEGQFRQEAEKNRKLNAQIQSLRNERAKNQAEIKKLNNIVALLKKELNK